MSAGRRRRPPLARSGRPDVVTRRPAGRFRAERAARALAKHFGTASLEGFGFGDDAADAQAIRAAGAILDYLTETQKSSLDHIDRLMPYRSSGTLEIDEATPPQPGNHPHAPRRPPRRLAAGGARPHGHGDGLAAAGRVGGQSADRRGGDRRAARRGGGTGRRRGRCATSCAKRSRRVYDVERLLARVTTGRASPRDLSFLGRTLRALPALKAKLDRPHEARCLSELEAAIDLCPDLRAKLDAALADDCPLVSREGGFIRDGFQRRARRPARAGPRRQAVDRPLSGRRRPQRTGIPSLKVGFNKVFGYYIEITQRPPRQDSRPTTSASRRSRTPSATSRRS